MTPTPTEPQPLSNEEIESLRVYAPQVACEMESQNYLRLITTIDHLRSQVAALQWRPIESAPRDGTKIDLWYPHDIGREPDSYWHEILKCWCCEKWVGRKHPQEVRYVTRNCEPTHWMPLPSPPSASEGTGVKG